MKENLYNLFTSEKAFSFCTLIGALLSLVCGTLYFISYGYGLTNTACCAVLAFCLLWLFFAYKKGLTVITTGMIGCLLVVNFISSLAYFQISSIVATDVVFEVLNLFASLILFINHFVFSQSPEKGSKKLTENQFIGFFLVLLNILWVVFLSIEGWGMIDEVLLIVATITFILIIYSVIFIETKTYSKLS